MSTPDEFRRYAAECIESAKHARDDIARQRFLDLAKMWMTAARQLDDGMAVPLVPADRSNGSTGRRR
ncbi:MAG: hypothetical protein K2Y71_00795 [Xanthobacteraceae bacterium]|nr:hypothetical protein [Xanthobacteraceae bacterium]